MLKFGIYNHPVHFLFLPVFPSMVNQHGNVLVDGVIVVVDGMKTRRAALSKAIRELEAAGARILGAVLNRARPDKHGGGYYVTDSERKRGRLKGTR